MIVRWTSTALANLGDIVDWIAADKPERAKSFAQGIHADVVEILRVHFVDVAVSGDQFSLGLSTCFHENPFE